MRKQKDKKNDRFLHIAEKKVIDGFNLHIHGLKFFIIIKKSEAWLGRWPHWKESIVQALKPGFGFRSCVKLGVVACACDPNLVYFMVRYMWRQMGP